MTSDKVMMKAGHQMTDGTVFVGVSPENGRDMFTLPMDAGIMNLSAAHKYARRCNVGGHRDWRLPSLNEADIMFGVHDQGALKNTFAQRAYWTNERHDFETNAANHIIRTGRPGVFPNGSMNLFSEDRLLALRLVRTPGASSGVLSHFIAKLGF